MKTNTDQSLVDFYEDKVYELMEVIRKLQYLVSVLQFCLIYMTMAVLYFLNKQ